MHFYTFRDSTLFERVTESELVWCVCGLRQGGVRRASVRLRGGEEDVSTVWRGCGARPRGLRLPSPVSGVPSRWTRLACPCACVGFSAAHTHTHTHGLIMIGPDSSLCSSTPSPHSRAKLQQDLGWTGRGASIAVGRLCGSMLCPGPGGSMSSPSSSPRAEHPVCPASLPACTRAAWPEGHAEKAAAASRAVRRDGER